MGLPASWESTRLPLVSARAPVLVAVDDEELNLSLIRRVAGSSYDVHTFADPKIAMNAVPPLAPDVLLLDFRMPAMTGVELLRELRERGVDAPALLVTGFADAAEVLAAERDKLILRVLAKPWRPAEILSEVALAVGIHRMDRAKRALRG